jgi:hypothetical protein
MATVSAFGKRSCFATYEESTFRVAMSKGLQAPDAGEPEAAITTIIRISTEHLQTSEAHTQYRLAPDECQVKNVSFKINLSRIKGEGLSGRMPILLQGSCKSSHDNFEWAF